MALAEADWSENVRESRRIRTILESLRIICSILVKRYLGVREGEYLNVEYLVEYEAIFRNPQKLREVIQPLEVSSSTRRDIRWIAGSSVRATLSPMHQEIYLSHILLVT